MPLLWLYFEAWMCAACTVKVTGEMSENVLGSLVICVPLNGETCMYISLPACDVMQNDR